MHLQTQYSKTEVKVDNKRGAKDTRGTVKLTNRKPTDTPWPKN